MKIINIILALGILFFASQTPLAQTTISNTPSTDAIETGSSYIEIGYSGHFGKYADGAFQTYGLKALYGLRRNLEIGANFSHTRAGNSSAPFEFAPNVKWKAYYNEKHKFAVSGGAVAFIPLRNKKSTRPSAFVYANASKEFNFAGGFRLTGGVYTTIGAKRDDGNRKGVMIGYEQTIYKRVSFFADWTSGKNRFGYTGAGLSIPLSKRDVLYTGYSFGNSGRGNNCISITYGRFF